MEWTPEGVFGLHSVTSGPAPLIASVRRQRRDEQLSTIMIVRRTGVFVICYAIASMVLFFADLNIRLLMWVDFRGAVIGWILRVAILIFGFWLFAKSEDWDP
jgi:hypothetical protein